MSGTFYEVLGVGPEADGDAVRAAYRERVKDHHPDVSSAPDATERFKRVTTAKETLLDPIERSRYDRLGHAAYVDAHGDPSLWPTDMSDSDGRNHMGASGSSASSAGESTDESSQSTDSEKRANGSRSTGRSMSQSTTNTESSDTSGSRTAWSRSSRSRTERDSSTRRRESTRAGRRTRTDGSTRAGGRTRKNGSAVNDSTAANREAAGADSGTQSPSGTGNRTATAHSESPSYTTESQTADVGSTSADRSKWRRAATNGTDDGSKANRQEPYSGSSGDSETRDDGSAGRATWSGFAGGRSEAPAGRDRSDVARGAYASGDFWDRTEVGARYGREAESVVRRFVDGLRTLGPWVLVHILFLSLAVGTGAYVYGVVLPPAERTLLLFFVLIGEIGLAVVLSSLHILARIYR